MLLVKRALDWASVWHASQARKYPGIRVPYVSHLAGVAAVLSRHGFADEVVAAGVLHDTLEDTETTFDELVAKFGVRVAELVRACSEEDKSLPWEERKARYLEAFAEKGWDAQAITLSDKIDNLQSILVCAQDFGDPWAQFKRGREAQLERFRALLERARRLSPHPLVDEYARVVAAVEAL
jgi:(p)ppGpp synthase/HD superfamily hydrolase